MISNSIVQGTAMPKKLWESSPKPWLAVWQHENYVYSERLGKDSIAVVAIKENIEGYLEVLLHEEFNPAHNKVIKGAIGGSMDKAKSPIATAQAELAEEAGFKVKEDIIMPVGTMFASTQTNEIVNLFIANVTDYKQGERNLDAGEDPWGLQKNTWVRWTDDLFETVEDPRFVVAMSRFVLKNTLKED